MAKRPTQTNQVNTLDTVDQLPSDADLLTSAHKDRVLHADLKAAAESTKWVRFLRPEDEALKRIIGALRGLARRGEHEILVAITETHYFVKKGPTK